LLIIEKWIHSSEYGYTLRPKMQDNYNITINKMFSMPKNGTLMYYFREFLLSLPCDEWWTQPQAAAFCNKRVAEDGGVDWNKKNGPKRHHDGSIVMSYGDPGRSLEKFRCETTEGCWDNRSGTKQGPFRLNLEKYAEFTGSTKAHSFTDKIKKDVMKRCEHKCELCGHKGTIEIDHFIPKEKGGQSTMENANALCARCNDRKCSKEPEKFMAEEFDRLFKYFGDRGMTDNMVEFIKTKFPATS
jgi:5-methylcytosine-specific restriction endonuclease McrA